MKDEKLKKRRIGIDQIERFTKLQRQDGCIYQQLKYIEIDSKILEYVSILKMEFTKLSTILLLTNGKVLSKGYNLLGREFSNTKQKKIFDLVLFVNENDKKKENVLIYDICAGRDYVLALDNNYQVWGWGSNSKRQLDPNINIKEFIKPKKLSFINENSIITQIFALDDSSIAVTKDKKIRVWGNNDDVILGKNKLDEAKSDYLEKTNISKYIEKELLKDDTDLTDSFIKARKHLSFGMNENLKSEKKINNNEENYINENEGGNEDLLNKINNHEICKMEEKLKRNIKVLEERVEEYDKELEEVNLKKDSLRINIKVIDDELNQIKIDKEKIENKKSEVIRHTNIKEEEYEINNTRSQNEDYFNPENNVEKFLNHEISQNESISIINNENSKKEKLRRGLFKDTLVKTIDKLIGIYDEKKTERNIILNEIIKLVNQENLYYENKKILTDMINLLNDYGLKSDYSEKMEQNMLLKEKQDSFYDLLLYLKSIEEKTFLNIYEKYNTCGSHKKSEYILNESRLNIEYIKNSFEKNYGNVNVELKKKAFIAGKKLIEHKLSLVEEQNNLINSIINLFNSMHKELITELEHCGLKNLGKTSNLRNKDERKNKQRKTIKGIFGLEKAKNKINENHLEVCRDMIVKFLKDTTATEEIQQKLEIDKNKLMLVEKNKVSSIKDESLKNNELFKKHISNSKMEDLIVMSNFNEDE